MTAISQFLALHQADDLLFLGNAWDVPSARALEKGGFKAIGTTSWGIAHSLGYTDGEKIDFDLHLAVIKRIVEQVSIPVSADLESGYAADAPTIIENVLRTADVGVAGINLEDSLKRSTGLRDMILHGDLLYQIRTALDHNGFSDFYINARIDTYFQKEDPLAETIERAKVYVESGASGIFVPGVKEETDIRAISAQVTAPLNVLSLPGLTDGKLLREWGVKRLSFGNFLYDKMVAFLENSAFQLYQTTDTASLFQPEPARF
ncbi:isocitrate lyase/PEP mutase family protein [Brevibacillus choshinensis]|uniref:Isocitrate lyase/phosphoenolpyruvate mutase family protein n=1 Tax=Brevibacillus choshinensis TaxID=54911 RepID=A0ABX7FN05_BRECH|nr:isocitrate lyase/phosphoenolpyruvate mutase family protein [Brevibacillus choshinensis]QRG67639.1 isocitrate lyase/phosphoenolpyruvate mutase family protein [Brevibacillus choshinensis]